MNTTGRIFRVSLLGESHGPAVGVLVDGCPPGIPVSASSFESDLARRRAGRAGTTARSEPDVPELVSGVHQGRTTGSPLLILFRNRDVDSTDYPAYRAIPRPGHADLVARLRSGGFADPRGGGHFSGRLTAGLVAAGALAKLLLPGAAFSTRIAAIGGRAVPEGVGAEAFVAAEAERAAAEGDSAGALVEIRVTGLPAGLGEPFFDSVEGTVARNLFAVPGVRGVEFGEGPGSGFAAAAARGSEHNDAYVSPDGRTATNRSGGASGGMTNGNDLVLRVAVKPTPTIARAQSTLDFGTGAMPPLEGRGRHDACIAIRAAVALEAATAVALADLALLARALQPCLAGDPARTAPPPRPEPEGGAR